MAEILIDGLTCQDDADSFRVGNMMLMRSWPSAQWKRLTPEWKLAMLALCCEALEAAIKQPVKQRYQKAAPVFVRCQQKDTQAIREGIPGHGPQRITAVYQRRVHLECGCSLPISWLPIWEQRAAEEFEKFIRGR